MFNIYLFIYYIWIQFEMAWQDKANNQAYPFKSASIHSLYKLQLYLTDDNFSQSITFRASLFHFPFPFRKKNTLNYWFNNVHTHAHIQIAHKARTYKRKHPSTQQNAKRRRIKYNLILGPFLYILFCLEFPLFRFQFTKSCFISLFLRLIFFLSLCVSLHIFFFLP